MQRNTRDIFKTLYFPDRPRGHVFIVDNSAAHQGGPNAYKTLAAAIEDCQSYRGDTIVVGCGHTETLTGSPSLTIAKHNIRIMGEGGYSTMPAFLLDGADTAHVLITGDDVTLENLKFKAGHADVAKAIQVQGEGFTIRNCWFQDNVATENFLIAISVGATDNDADGLLVEGCHFHQPDTASTNAVWFVKNQDHCRVIGNFIDGHYDADQAIIGSPGTENFLDLWVLNNRINNAGDDTVQVIEFAGTNTGMCAGNWSSDLDAGATPFTATGMAVHENYHSGVAGASGYIQPARDS